MYIVKRLLCLLFLLGLPPGGHTAGTHDELLVFAAASLRDAIDSIVERYEDQYDRPVLTSYASSSVLARQIAHGAEADIYISANPQWMDYLAEREAIVDSSRRDLLGNRLVLVTQHTNDADCSIAADCALHALLADGYLAMGDPAHVPAGMYGQAALESLDLWSSLQDHVARADNVRAALALVASGESPLGIVYRSDAVAEERVRVVDTFPPYTHPAIIYPVAKVASSHHAGSDHLLDFLQTEEAAAIFRQYGFNVLKSHDNGTDPR